MGPGHGRDVPAVPDRFLTDPRAQVLVGIVEVLVKVCEKRIAVCSDSLLYPIEYRLVHPFRIVRRLQEVRWDAADEHRLRNILGTISSLVARDFAASHTETDKSDILEVELVEQLVKILAERIVVVASCGFAGLAEAPACVCDYSVSGVYEGRELSLPASPAQRVSVNQNNWFTGTMILIVKINIP